MAIIVKSDREIALMRQAGRIVAIVLGYWVEKLERE